MTALDEIAERSARARVVAAATGLGLTPAQEDVATLLDVLADVARTTSGTIARVVELMRQRDDLVAEVARARGCSEDVVLVQHGIDGRPEHVHQLVDVTTYGDGATRVQACTTCGAELRGPRGA